MSRAICCATFWHACLVGLMLLPIVSAAFPRWRIDFVDRTPVMPVHVVDTTIEWDVHRRPLVHAAVLYERAVTSPLMARPTASDKALAFLARWPAAMAFLFVVGAAALTARLLFGLRAVGQTRRHWVPIDNPEWLRRLQYWRQRLGITRKVALCLSDEISVPVMIGWLRPTILVPASVFGENRAHRDSVLVHELSHVRRGDYLWHVLLRIVGAIYWFNPLA